MFHSMNSENETEERVKQQATRKPKQNLGQELS